MSGKANAGNRGIEEARTSAERTLGFVIPRSIAEEVLSFAKFKLKIIEMPDNYLPLLYENELTDYFMRLAINQRGELNRVRHLSSASM